MSGASNLRIDGSRLLARLDALGRIGSTGDGGVRRLAGSDADKAGRDQLCAWIAAAGLEAEIDRVGNIIAVLPGRTAGPMVVMGSHIDTVATGGRFDGALGVLAGLEVLTTLREAGFVPQRPMALVAFTNEEGARFHPDMLGSCVVAGVLPLEDALAAEDGDGTRLGDELARIGYAGARDPRALAVHAYLELHIEQGPVLDASGGGIAAVTGVQAITWLEATVTGEANHAGTTPLAFRRDAGLAAARLAIAARDIARAIPDELATIGVLRLEPGNVNVVPRAATMTVDLRNPSDALLADAEARLRALAADIAAADHVTFTFKDLARFPAQPFDAGLIGVIEAHARRLGHPVRRMTSGAGHDAQMMARMAPAAMIFVPSRAGLSHTPDEFTAPADIVAGAEVLFAAACELAEQ